MTDLKKKKLFLFDIDGTLSIGDTLYDGSRELLEEINARGGKSYFITNNSTRSNLDYVQKFQSAFHLATVQEQFVTSGYMTLRFLKEQFPAQKIFVLGTSSYIQELRRNGLLITEEAESDIACVLVAYDSELNYRKLTKVCQVLLTQDVPFYATNPDLRCPIDFGFIPDCGAICNMITATTDKKPIYLGKPSRQVVDFCLAASGFAPDETLVVGDRLYTDIACGINANVDTCVVYTGEATPEEVASSPYQPSYAFSNIKELLNAYR